MKIMAIDYGKKWIGLAVSDDSGKMAFPYKILENNSGIFSRLNEIIKKEGIYEIVVGLPLNKQMKPTEQTRETENWAEGLAKKIEIPIVFENEIMSSREAEKSGASKNHSAAAAIFLQSYLDRNKGN